MPFCFPLAGGSRPIGSLDWAAASGIVQSSLYPYTGINSPACQPVFGRSKQTVFAGSVDVSLATANPLYLALQQAPVAITVWADGLNELFIYMGGATCAGAAWPPTCPVSPCPVYSQHLVVPT